MNLILPQIMAQIVAVIIILLMAVGAQSKTQGRFLAYQMSINMLYGVHYALLSATTAVVIAVICVVRTLIFFLYKRAEKRVPIWLFCVILLAVVGAGIATWQGWLSILPILSTISFTYGQWQHDVNTTRKTVIFGDFGWVVYNAFCKGYIDIIGKIVEITSCAIAMRRRGSGGANQKVTSAVD